MSVVPRELRDRVVRRLESALADRDRKLRSLSRDVSGLRGMLGDLEGEMTHQRELGRRLARDIERAGADLRRERREALERLECLQQQAEDQHRRLVGEIESAERRHRDEWQALDRRIDKLASEREARDQLIRDAGCAATRRADRMLAALDGDEVEAMDLGGRFASARIQLDGAQAPCR